MHLGLTLHFSIFEWEVSLRRQTGLRRPDYKHHFLLFVGTFNKTDPDPLKMTAGLLVLYLEV